MWTSPSSPTFLRHVLKMYQNLGNDKTIASILDNFFNKPLWLLRGSPRNVTDFTGLFNIRPLSSYGSQSLTGRRNSKTSNVLTTLGEHLKFWKIWSYGEGTSQAFSCPVFPFLGTQLCISWFGSANTYLKGKHPNHQVVPKLARELSLQQDSPPSY